MTCQKLTFLITSLILLAGGVAQAQPDSEGLVPIEGQIIIKVEQKGNINAIIKKIGGEIIDRIAEDQTYLIGFPVEVTIAEVSALLQNDISIDYFHPNFPVELPEVHQISQGFPDHESPAFVNGVSPPDYFGQPGVYATGIDEAHDITTGAGIRIAVIDNGVDMNQPMVSAANIEFGRDFVDEGDQDPSEVPGTLYGHGTFTTVLTLLAAPDAIIMPLRAFDEEGFGNIFEVAHAIRWAISHQAKVINMSFGTSGDYPVLKNAVNEALANGISMVASTGNNGLNIAIYPAAYSGVIAVTAFDTLEYRADFANYGNHVDLSAPGINIYSGLAGAPWWGTWSGTSFAVPFVSGSAALVLSSRGNLTPGEIQVLFRASARTELQWGQIIPQNPEYGFGALDAFAAVTGDLIGDLNASGTVDTADFILLSEYIFEGGEPKFPLEKADLNHDNAINISDLRILGCIIAGMPGSSK